MARSPTCWSTIRRTAARSITPARLSRSREGSARFELVGRHDQGRAQPYGTRAAGQHDDLLVLQQVHQTLDVVGQLLAEHEQPANQPAREDIVRETSLGHIISTPGWQNAPGLDRPTRRAQRRRHR